MCRSAILCRVLLGVLLTASPIYAQCRPTALSQREGQQLLEAIPQALAAQHAGGKLSVVEWNPGSGYRAEVFYLYMLLSTKSLPTTPLDNGVLGYFGVNKTTGEVVELNSGKPSVQGTTLMKLQKKIRASHCIDRQLVIANQDIPLEK